MQVNAKDLSRLLSRGEDFERLLYAIVVKETTYRHRLPLASVSWDPNVYRADGGRDIIISATHTDSVFFIPNSQSVWSAKTGAESLDPRTLTKELQDPRHSPLRRLLDNGYTYVWCSPLSADHDVAPAFKDAFLSITDHKGNPLYGEDQLVIYTAAHLEPVINMDPGIASTHFPHLASLYGGLTSSRGWSPSSDTGLRSAFVTSSSRDALIARTRMHLLSQSGPAVLHIAGLSGVGKTRVVHEALYDRVEFASVLYTKHYNSSLSDTLKKLKHRNPTRVLLVADEVPMEDYVLLSREFDDDSQVRLVTIGPARRDARCFSENVVIVAPPETREEVLPVLETNARGLSHAVLLSIAEMASHDIRLGLLLVKATQSSADFIDLPVPDGTEMWRRICHLYQNDISSVKDFPSLYPFLTVAIDIGYKDRDEHEIASIAQFFEVPLVQLLGALLKADEIGLGVCSPHFFEAGPRALAACLFQQLLSKHINLQFTKLMAVVSSERLRRRIIERCQELTGDARVKADKDIADFFQRELGGKDIAQLTNASAAKSLKAWAELDPDRGLRWLRDSIGSTSATEIESLDKSSDQRPGPSPRRQIVWLCESLAAFERHFSKCEEILFRLLAVETERGLGNNSTEIWKGLFLPVLSFTEVPFQLRHSLLLNRLAGATDQTIEAVVDAVIDAIGTHFGGRCSPPRVVGGYLTPPSWMPASAVDLYDLQKRLAQSFLSAIESLPASLRAVAMRKTVDDLGDFHRLGLLGQLRTLLDHSGAELLGIAKQKASRLLTYYTADEVATGDQGPGTAAELLAFELDLTPKSLLQRIEDTVTQNAWDVRERHKWNSSEGATDPYRALASDICSAPDTLAKCKDLFASERVRSDGALGAMCGLEDETDALTATVEEWLKAGVCSGFVSGYLEGAAHRQGALPPRWRNLLDELAEVHPRIVADITLGSDHTQRGLHRLLQATRTGVIQPAILYRLAFTKWSDAMDDAARVEVVASLCKTPETVRIESLSTSLKLGQLWGSFGKAPYTPDLSGTLQLLLEQAIGVTREADAWVDVMSSVGITLPQEAIGLATAALVLRKPMQSVPNDLLLPPLKHLAASHPTLAMSAIGDLLLDPKHRSLFGMLKFEGLFDSIGLDAVREWAMDKPTDTIALVARHLDGPSISPGGPVVPPVADWLFQKFGTDGRVFAEFCLGRHAFEWRGGTAMDRRPALQELVEPFLNHERQWVRKWANYELKLNKEEEKWDALHEEDVERR
jgi:hypothetical protein